MNNLFIGIKGQVVCIEKQSGKKIWSTKLKGMSITNVIYNNKQLFAYASGHLFCLDADFGKILWKNSLSGYGYGPCLFATEDATQQQAYITQHEQQQKKTQAASGTP